MSYILGHVNGELIVQEAPRERCCPECGSCEHPGRPCRYPHAYEAHEGHRGDEY